MPRCPELNNDPAVEGKRSRIWPRNVIRMQAFHAARLLTGKFACFFKKSRTRWETVAWGALWCAGAFAC